MARPRLFSKYDLRETLERREAQLKKALDAYDADALLNANLEDLVQHFVASAEIEPIRLLDDDITADTAEAPIDVSHRFEYGGFDGERTVVPGTLATLHVPFVGDRDLLLSQASTRSFNSPVGDLSANEIVLSFHGTEGDMERAKKELHAELAKVREHVSWVNKDVAAFNGRLPQVASSAVEARRARLLEQRSVAGSLGFPVRQRPGVPKTYSVPAKRKVVKPGRRSGSGARFVPEPTLDDAIFDSILEVLANMVQVMEASPDAFSSMGEEDLRTHFLVQLNGQFEVGATGETFRGSGSTDILLGQDGRNVFLAECKFWQGPRSLSQALDQLLDYTVWRDAKAAILLFNRNKNLTAVLEKIPGVLEEHQQIASAIARLGETAFRFALRNRDDPDRLIAVTLLVFDVPTARSRSDRLTPRAAGS